MTVSINITGLESIAQAINSLAVAISGKNIGLSIDRGNPLQPEIQVPEKSQGIPQTPTMPMQQAYVPSIPTPVTPNHIQGQVQQRPVAPVASLTQTSLSNPYQPTAGQIPTTATTQTYTQDQLAVAMTGLMDQGKGALLMSILQQFGAQSLMQVSKDHYPEVAIKLREAGANI